MEEKRKHKRVNLIYYLEIFDNTTDKHLGYLVDITPEGLMMISEEQMPSGEDFISGCSCLRRHTAKRLFLLMPIPAGPKKM